MKKAQTRQERLELERANAPYSVNGSGDVADEKINSIKKIAKQPDKELAFAVLNHESFTTGIPGYLNAATGSISDIIKHAVPKGKSSQIQKACQFYEEDDLLNKLVNIKMDFVTMGMDVSAQPRGKVSAEKIEAFQQRLDNVELDIDIQKLGEDLVRDWIISDNMILYWRTDIKANSGLSSEASTPEDEFEHVGIPGVYDICALNPGDVNWDNSLGQDILEIRISQAVKDKVSVAFGLTSYTAFRKTGAEAERIYKDLMDEGIGKKWIDAVLNKQEFVTLQREDGDNWLIDTKARKHCGLASPSMKTIFLRLEQRKILTEGDFSASVMMKHFIMMVKQGESITQGALAGQRTNWITQPEADALLQNFAGATKALRIAVNHTTTVEFVFPPPEMFNLEKFEKCELCIYTWSGITITIVLGEGGKYASGYISIKRMVADIGNIRGKVSRLFTRFFKHPTVAPRLETPENTLVSINYNSDVLKEPRQLLTEVQFMFDNSIMDHRSAARTLDRDPETLKASAEKTRAENENGHWKPVETQGQVSFNNAGGRPADDGTTVSESTRTQSPTASPTENT